MSSLQTLSLALFLTLVAVVALDKCPGEGPRYGDFKCNHDQTHRVCAQLVDNADTCNELNWGDGSFWEITGQQKWNWKEQVCAAPNPGNGWCICMWATARLIESAGCDNVHIECDATDVKYVLDSYHDGGVKLGAAHECLKKKCQ